MMLSEAVAMIIGDRRGAWRRFLAQGQLLPPKCL